MDLKSNIIFILCLLCFSIQAQDVLQKKSIISELQSKDPQGSKGVIRITADPEINNLLGVPWDKTTSVEKEYIKAPGYRVQVFSGNNSKTSKDEASRKERLIKESFPETRTYIDYRPPRWSLRVGDFRSQEEAKVFMNELRKVFPDFGREMYPVKVDEANIPVNNQE